MGYSNNRNNLGDDSSGSDGNYDDYDEDDDSSTNRRRKKMKQKKKNAKKHKKNSNPLSHARGKQQKHENIWFRRSQLGYKLFVEYYCNQPIGTISSTSSSATSLSSSRRREELGDASRGGGGCGGASAAVAIVGGGSRAAKRREKKKRKLQHQNDGEPSLPPPSSKTMNMNHSTATIRRTPTTSNGNSMENDNPMSSNPLLEAYDKYLTRTQQGKADGGVSTAICSLRRSFFEVMSQPLPLTFRFRKSHSINNNRDDLFPKEFHHIMKSVPFDSSIYQAIRQPSSTSSSSSLSVLVTKENVGKLYPSLKDWLIQQSTNGSFAIARQEFGSMLPVYILHQMGYVTYGTRMVDMCSSPGSKTLQSLEIICNKRLCKEEEGKEDGGSRTKKAKKPEKAKVKMGKIVANDVSETRLQTLRDAIERSGIPSKWLDRIIYKCQDASKLQLSNSNSPTKYPYNVILCDVPCSGDATCRKDKHILPMWKPNFGNELHTLQLKILLRALELVSVVNDNSDSGGIVCYSTCSLNPIEDEAVVASAIQQYNAAQEKKKMMLNKNSNRDEDDDEDCYHVELVEWSEATHNRPKELILHPGITTWKVAEYNDSEITSTASISVKKGGSSHSDNKRKRTNEQGEDVNIEENEDSDDDDDDKMTRLKWYTSWDDVEDNSSSSQLSKSMFPPLSSESASSTSTTAKLHLERCLRLLPQDQDTGGFFVAILEKKKLSTKMKQ